MLAPSGQYLKKNINRPDTVLVFISSTIPASMWISLQPSDFGQSAAFHLAEHSGSGPQCSFTGTHHLLIESISLSSHLDSLSLSQRTVSSLDVSRSSAPLSSNKVSPHLGGVSLSPLMSASITLAGGEDMGGESSLSYHRLCHSATALSLLMKRP